MPLPSLPSLPRGVCRRGALRAAACPQCLKPAEVRSAGARTACAAPPQRRALDANDTHRDLFAGRWVADIKRSLVKDLNPIIGVKPEFRASVQHGATQLFQTYETDMNGRHHAVIRISNVNGKTRTEHVRQLLAQGEFGSTPGEAEEAGSDDSTYEQGEESMDGPRPMQGEPEDCPYPLPTVEGDDNGKSHKTSTSNGGELEEYDEEASLGMGHEHPEEKVKVRDLQLVRPARSDFPCYASLWRDHTNTQCLR